MASKQRRYSMGGLEIPVVPADSLTPESVLMCPNRTIPLLQPENQVGRCHDCGKGIQWHPSSPKCLDRVCVTCATCRVRTHPDPRVVICEDQATFLDGFLARKEHS